MRYVNNSTHQTSIYVDEDFKVTATVYFLGKTEYGKELIQLCKSLEELRSIVTNTDLLIERVRLDEAQFQHYERKHAQDAA